MTGETLKTRISSCGVSQAEIARRLGMSQQSFNQALLVADVKTGLLERICEALGVDMSFFYPVGSTNNTTNNIHKQSAHNMHNGSGDIREEKGDNETIAELVKQNATLIELLKSKM